MSIPRGLLEVAGLVLVSSVLAWGVRSGAEGAAPPPAAGRAPVRAPAAPSGRALAALNAGCLLFSDAARTATSADCRACHVAGGAAGGRGGCHPVELEYAPAGPSLRPVDEVVRRGVFLPDGKLRCVTCHDGRSPWAFALALPPGAAPAHAVSLADPRTYEAGQAPLPPPQPGDRVSPKPLCLACHALD